MFNFILEPLFFIPYILFNFCLALYVYTSGKKFFEKILNESDSENIEMRTMSIHDKYPEFKRYDQLSFMRIFLGLLFLFWIKMTILIFLLLIVYVAMKITFWNSETNSISHEKRRIITKIFRISCGIGLFIIGIMKKEEKSNAEDVYKKYLGGDYGNYTYDEGFASIISNHVSWIEILYYLQRFAPGFIAKDTIKDFPMIGLIGCKIECLFLDRTNLENRLQVAEKIKNRQESFMNGNTLTPLMIFPEGTLTSGKHLLKFKRGAFQNLLPLKPMIAKIDQHPGVSLSTGALKFFIHLIMVLCFFYHHITFIEMPIIHPTDFMFKNFSHLGRDKWEVYSEVVREIYCEVGGFEKSHKTFKEMLDYLSEINGKPVLNT